MRAPADVLMRAPADVRAHASASGRAHAPADVLMRAPAHLIKRLRFCSLIGKAPTRCERMLLCVQAMFAILLTSILCHDLSILWELGLWPNLDGCGNSDANIFSKFGDLVSKAVFGTKFWRLGFHILSFRLRASNRLMGSRGPMI